MRETKLRANKGGAIRPCYERKMGRLLIRKQGRYGQMNEDLRRTMAIRNFISCFKELRKYEDLGYHAKTGLHIDTTIEVCRYNGERKERILKISEENETVAYEKAASILMNKLKHLKKDRKGRRIA